MKKEPEGRHHLVLCFEPDGEVRFFPETDDPAALADRLSALIRILVENPSAVQRAAGNHQEHRHDAPPSERDGDPDRSGETA